MIIYDTEYRVTGYYIEIGDDFYRYSFLLDIDDGDYGMGYRTWRYDNCCVKHLCHVGTIYGG